MSDTATSNRFTARDLEPVPGIYSVEGWSLLRGDYQDSDGFTTPIYVARGPERDVLLNVSRFDFTPTQARFAFLVEFGFPADVVYSTGVRGPLSDHTIDVAIERRAA